MKDNVRSSYNATKTQPHSALDKYNDQADKLNKILLSESDKTRKNSELARYAMDHIISQPWDMKQVELDLEHIGLLFGRWDNLKPTGLNVSMQIKGDNGAMEKISYGRKHLRHYDMIQKVGQSSVAGMLTQNKDMIIKDYCLNSIKYKEDQSKAIIRDRLTQLYVKPKVAEAEKILLAKFGDPLLLEDGAAEQRQKELDLMLEQMIDIDVRNAIENIQVPKEELLTQLYKAGVIKSEIDYECEKGANYAVATGKEFYRKRYGDGAFYVECIPTHLARYCLSYRSDFVDDALWFTNRRYLTPIEILTDNYHTFKGKSFKELESMMEDMPSSMVGQSQDVDVRINHPDRSDPTGRSYNVLANKPRIENNEFVRATPVHGDGKMWVEGVEDKLWQAYLNRGKGICVDYVTWRWPRKAKTVLRKVVTPKGGTKIKRLTRGENYRMNKERGDVKVFASAVASTYEGERAGDEFYYDVGPVRNMYPCPDSFDRPKLGVTGGVYNTLNGAVKNVSLVGPMKPYQFRINVLEEVLGDSVANHIGNVLVVNEESMSKTKGGMNAFFNLLYKFKVIQKKSNKGGKNIQDIYSVNAGGNVDIAAYEQLLQRYKREIIEAGNSSEAEYRGLGQYATRDNINASLSSASNRKFRLYSFNKRIKENLHRELMVGSFYAFHDNDYIKNCFLTDEMKALYDGDFEGLLGSLPFIKVEVDDNNGDRQALESFRQAAIAYMSAGGDLKDLSKIFGSQTMSQIQRVVDRAQLERSAEQARAQEAQMRQQQSLAEQNAQLRREEMDREDRREELKQEGKIAAAHLYSLGIAHGNDVNENGQNDFSESKDKDREWDKEKTILNNEAEMELQKLKNKKQK